MITLATEMLQFCMGIQLLFYWMNMSTSKGNKLDVFQNQNETITILEKKMALWWTIIYLPLGIILRPACKIVALSQLR